MNPLARKFQTPIELEDDWVERAYADPSLPLHLDVGCGKGGFLLEFAAASDERRRVNHLGLEIRPAVAEYARERVAKREHLVGRLLFLGCNANVDLDRLLTRYAAASPQRPLDLTTTIQFPDPHFKKRNRKKRVVTPGLVSMLAKHAAPGNTVFLQSDVREVLDDMRERFREHRPAYFRDSIDDVEEYLEENVTGVPTEREVSVLKKGLPVYRALFTRTEVAFCEDTVAEEEEEGEEE